MVPAALVAVVVDYAINIGVVSLAAGLSLRLNPVVVLRQLSRGQEFLLSYVGLGLVGTVLAKLSSLEEVGPWAVVVVLAPLLFARQMFIQIAGLGGGTQGAEGARAGAQDALERDGGGAR